jgi:hypothetical protein
MDAEIAAKIRQNQQPRRADRTNRRGGGLWGGVHMSKAAVS